MRDGGHRHDGRQIEHRFQRGRTAVDLVAIAWRQLKVRYPKQR
jgi:hypothetical protein